MKKYCITYISLFLRIVLKWEAASSLRLRAGRLRFKAQGPPQTQANAAQTPKSSINPISHQLRTANPLNPRTANRHKNSSPHLRRRALINHPSNKYNYLDLIRMAKKVKQRQAKLIASNLNLTFPRPTHPSTRSTAIDCDT